MKKRTVRRKRPANTVEFVSTVLGSDPASLEVRLSRVEKLLAKLNSERDEVQQQNQIYLQIIDLLTKRVLLSDRNISFR